MPPESGGEDGPETSGGTKGGGGGLTGERDHDAEAGSGAADVGGSSGRAGAGGTESSAGTGGMGGVMDWGGTAGMGGVAGTIMGGAGGTTGGAGGATGGAGGAMGGAGGAMGGTGGSMAGSGGAGGKPATGCGPDDGAVCLADNTNRAVFYDASGKVIDYGETPRQQVLPDGGMITVINGAYLTSYVGVPGGTTIRTEPWVKPEKKAVQSIQVTVSQYPGVEAGSTWVSTGCEERALPAFGVPLNMKVNEQCLVDGKAQILIEAGLKAFILVTNIELGSSLLEPKVITLPDWKPLTWAGSFTLDGLPDRFQNQFQSQVAFKAFYGASRIANIYSKFNNSKARVDSIMPEFGAQWWRWIQVSDASKLADRREYAETWESVGYPLPASQTKEYSTTLSAPQVALDGREISISGVTDPQVDRVLTTVSFKDAQPWQIWSPPGVTKIVLPTEPAEVGQLSSGPIQSVVVRVEDSAELTGYADAFEYFSHGNDVDTVDPALGRPRSYRFAERRLVF